MKPTLLILAAGIGSRYGGLKQIDPIGLKGETIIDYSVYDGIRAGFGKLVFIIRKEIELDFRATLGQKFEKLLPVEYVYQELDRLPEGFTPPPQREKPWGTGHAVLVAEDAIQEPFAVINADDFYGRSSFQVLADYLSQSRDTEMAQYSMVGFTLRNTLSEHGSVARGICQLDEQNFLQNVVEVTQIEKANSGAKYPDQEGNIHHLSGDEIVSMNMWGFTPSIFKHLKKQFAEFLQEKGQKKKAEFYIPTAVNRLIQEQKAQVKVLSSGESWFGVTYKEDRPQVVKSIRHLVSEGVYPENLWQS